LAILHRKNRRELWRSALAGTVKSDAHIRKLSFVQIRSPQSVAPLLENGSSLQENMLYSHVFTDAQKEDTYVRKSSFVQISTGWISGEHP